MVYRLIDDNIIQDSLSLLQNANQIDKFFYLVLPSVYQETL